MDILAPILGGYQIVDSQQKKYYKQDNSLYIPKDGGRKKLVFYQNFDFVTGPTLAAGQYVGKVIDARFYPNQNFWLLDVQLANGVAGGERKFIRAYSHEYWTSLNQGNQGRNVGQDGVQIVDEEDAPADTTTTNDAGSEWPTWVQALAIVAAIVIIGVGVKYLFK